MKIQPLGAEVKGWTYQNGRLEMEVPGFDIHQMIVIETGTGKHADKNVCSYDEVPALGPLQVKIRLPKRPAQVTLQPQGRSSTILLKGVFLR